MALQTSGAISLSQVQGEFGGSNPISMSEYYGRDPLIPNSGTIDMADFYGSKKIHYSRSTTPVFYWLWSDSYTNRIYWNGTEVTNGFANSATTATAGGFTYTRGTLQYTTYLKGAGFFYYDLSRAA